MISLQTVREGERIAVWAKDGSIDFITGPKRLLLYNRVIQPLRRYTAAADEYLVIKFKDGHHEHLQGPAGVWHHPIEHAEVTTHKAVSLDASEALVVYRQDLNRVDRRVVRGPSLFVPAANEWLHQFSWHGSDPNNPRRKIPHTLKFQKLWVIPDQTYVDVDEVRTADDALLQVKLMVFFELGVIERMLDQTHDPIADFINAVSADLIDFAATLSFEQFKQQTERLNDLATYLQLVHRAERIGYKINKVVHRGYQASAKLQTMHDNAIEARTRLQLDAATENQAQAVADLKIARELERSEKRRQMEQAEAEHQNRLKRASHEETLRQLRLEQEQDLQLKRAANELQIQHGEALKQQRLNYLQAVRGLQVDMTQYLTARYRHPDRLIRIEGGQASRLHLHENNS